MENYDCLKLENQLCFPLYVCAKEVVRQYKPFLDEIDLTYTQYIAMMVMWEQKEITVKGLGEYLFLDSGTLTPVLKHLEKKGYVERTRSKEDERNLIISLTSEGEALKEKALSVPGKVSQCVSLNADDAKELYRILNSIMNKWRKSESKGEE
ncbi:MAG: MarR family transcriptional regulator [Lachnospiraceae bacterium]|nr:MarR family transcriptional regulator [Candidatus Merdinaster equi]